MNHNEHYPVNHVSTNLKLMSESNSTDLRVYDPHINEPQIDITSIKPNVTPPKVTSPSEDESTITSDIIIKVDYMYISVAAFWPNSDNSLYIHLIARISIEAVEGIGYLKTQGQTGKGVQMSNLPRETGPGWGTRFITGMSRY